MNDTHKLTQGTFEGERALFKAEKLYITNSVFQNGESPLKHSKDIILDKTVFDWKYPLWYSENIECVNVTFSENARAGVWYTNNISCEDCTIHGPKNFRRSSNIRLKHVNFTNALETFWACKDVTLEHIVSNGDYFGMNSENFKINNFTIHGNYPFDGAKNIEISNAELISKDSFWNTENIYIENSYISGEYFGWNSKNITLVNCTIESLQGFCFIDNLKMVNCKLENTTLAFEYSNVDCEINSRIGSVKNPYSGIIKCKGIDELIMEEDKVDTKKTTIIIGD